MSSNRARRKSTKSITRLSWPTSITSTLKSTGEATTGNQSIRRKRRRLDDEETTSSTGLWVEEFYPTRADDLCVAPKKVQECRSWLLSAIDNANSGLGGKLLILCGGPGVGKSTTIRVLAEELKIHVNCWNSSTSPWHGSASHSHPSFSIEQVSPVASFEEFLHGAGSGVAPLSSNDDNGTVPQRGQRSIILLEELPNLHGVEAKERFHRIMLSHLYRSRVPTVIIYSDVTEGKYKPGDLEDLFGKELLEAPESQICQVHSVTKARMKKTVEGILNKKGHSVSPSFIEELHAKSSGDLRHAIMTIQMTYIGSGTGPRAAEKPLSTDRDTKLSTFHALGKLLYSKETIDSLGQRRMAFDPDIILERSDLGVTNSIRFLQHNSLSFYSNIEDISSAYDLFSDSCSLLQLTAVKEPAEKYASAIAGRTVFHSNKHPAPKRFRAFNTPPIFDVLKKKRHNEFLAGELSREMSCGHLLPSFVSRGSSAFMSEILGSARIILPQIVEGSMSKLSSTMSDSPSTQTRQTFRSMPQTVTFQPAVLEGDDIEDDDDDDESNQVGTS